jgi:hypothetical protein
VGVLVRVGENVVNSVPSQVTVPRIDACADTAGSRTVPPPITIVASAEYTIGANRIKDSYQEK